MQLLKLSLLAACLGGLVACGGSSKSSSNSLSGKVIDGYIQGAQVCLDLNNNMACDTGEPSAITGSDGSYSFSYSGSIAGKHVLALVTAGAVDSDSGTVVEPYSLLAPAESPKTVTPLSTLVSHEMISTGASTVEATANLKADFKFNHDPLNYDFKNSNDDETLKLAQAVASSIAMANKTIKNDATAAVEMSPSQMMKAAIKEVKENFLPIMIKPNGTVDAPVCHPHCNQTQLTTHISTNSPAALLSISGRIQAIVSESKSGNGTVASFSEVFSNGLSVLSFRSGDYYITPTQIGVYTNKLKVELYTLSNTSLTRVAKIMVSNTWFNVYETPSDFVTLWDGARWLEFVDDSDFGGTPYIEGNCVSLAKLGSTEKLQKACLVAKDVSGKKMVDVFPDICKENGAEIPNCNGAVLLPAGSLGYEMGFQNLKLNIEFQVDNDSTGFANNLSDFKLTTSSRTSAHSIGDNGNVCFYFENAGATSGTVRWAAKDANCSTANTNYSETTNYTIETIGNREVMIADVPNIFRKLNPRGLQNGCKFAFAAVKNYPANLSQQVLGIHQGDYCEANTRSTIPFNGDIRNGMQFISQSLLNFLLEQRKLPLWSST